MHKRLFLTGATLIFLVTATIFLVLYGSGYRLAFNQHKVSLSGTGLFVATSTPDGASVFLNRRLTSATNTTLNLPPGTYDVKITKDGYIAWEKKLTVQEEIVTKAQALLLPLAPKLESITAIGANNPTIDPTGTRIAFLVATSTPKKNGVYLLDMAGRPILTLQNSTQLGDDIYVTFSKSALSWSPNGKDIIASVSAGANLTQTFLLVPDKFTQTPLEQSVDLPLIKAQWDKEAEEKEKARLASLTPKVAKMVRDVFGQSKFSPDETKVLYVASASATLEKVIIPPLPGSNTQPEERTIVAGKLYIYDIKEDKNFFISDRPERLASLSWMPNSYHLAFIEDKKVKIMEYDGTNRNVLYSGPLSSDFVAPWPDGSKLVVLTNLGAEGIEPNLYTISLR